LGTILAMFESYLARQPIFDRTMRLYGYELLYRSDRGGPLSVDGNQATSDVLINSYIEIGLDKLVGGHLAFINVTRDFIVNHEKLPPPSEQLVLEVLEDVEADDEVLAAVKALIDKNYTIALDDFDYGQKNRGLIQLAHIVKIDIKQRDGDDLVKMVASLRKLPIKLVAEKVETAAQYELCRVLNFDYFQGFFLCHPKLIRGQRLSANKLHVMQLLAKLQQEDPETSDLAGVIEQDVALSYKLLRYINSASISLRHKIDSIRHAIVVLGQNNVRQWASMIALSSMEEKSGELIRTSLLRAKMCELLVAPSGQGNCESAFMVGLFSTLDALTGSPMDELLEMLPINQDIKDALLYHQGQYGSVLKCALAYEQGEWGAVERAGFHESEASSSYLQAAEWCDESARSLLHEAA
jgi:EAL and modified HD-GYP domain-containing signal transduction protein